MQNTSFKRLITISYMAKHFTDGLEKAHQYFFTMKWWWWGWGGGGVEELGNFHANKYLYSRKKEEPGGEGVVNVGEEIEQVIFYYHYFDNQC